MVISCCFHAFIQLNRKSGKCHACGKMKWGWFVPWTYPHNGYSTTFSGDWNKKSFGGANVWWFFSWYHLQKCVALDLNKYRDNWPKKFKGWWWLLIDFFLKKCPLTLWRGKMGKGTITPVIPCRSAQSWIAIYRSWDSVRMASVSSDSSAHDVKNSSHILLQHHWKNQKQIKYD